jgi:hypothetical protein
LEDNFVTFGFDNSNIGIQKYLDEARKAAKSVTVFDRKKDFGATRLDDLPLAMAYVPMQTLKEKYDQDTALKNGTLFPELDKPFLGRRI